MPVNIGTIIIKYYTQYGETPSTKYDVSGYTISQEDLPELIYENMIFEGWYSTETFDYNTKIEVGYIVAQDLTLYAKWSIAANVNAKMTVIANEIRELSGNTELMGLDAMATNLDNINTEMENQTDLIEQIIIALNDKAAGEDSIELPTLTNAGDASDLLEGKQLISQSGNIVEGTIKTKTASDLTANGATVIVPSGYYASQTTKNVNTATQATPSINVSSSGLITASTTQAAGYVAGGTLSATKQLTVQNAQTIIPGTTNQTIASGKYLTGVQTIEGDSNLIASNIKSGVSIFGVTGSYQSGENISGETNETCTLTVINSSTRRIWIDYWTVENNIVVPATSQLIYENNSMVFDNVACKHFIVATPQSGSGGVNKYSIEGDCELHTNYSLNDTGNVVTHFFIANSSDDITINLYLNNSSYESQ